MTENFFIHRSYTFMTSLEVIREVMNVPMEAIHAIARMNGISTADDHEEIVSEKELRPFNEAFERKTRNYFINSMRNSAQLSPEELQTFTEFCKTFKKGNVSLGKVSNWSHIGKTKLRQYFVDKIKEKTPSSHTHHTFADLFAGCGGIEAILSRALYSDSESFVVPSSHFGFRMVLDSESNTIEYRRQPSQDLLVQINSDWKYHAGIKRQVVHYNADTHDIIRQVVLSARYYIYIDDEEDHQSDTVSSNGQQDHIINRTCRMVA